MENVHTLNLQEKYFELIKNNIKTLEGRLNDEKRQAFNVGDKILFFKEPDRVEMLEAVIVDKYIFKNFDEMAENLDKAELGFESVSKQEMVDVYRKIYPREKEEKYGVVIFRVRVWND